MPAKNNYIVFLLFSFIKSESLGLNGNDSYISNNYITDYDVKATNAKSEVFETITDKKGNLLKTFYGTVEQINCTYDNTDRLTTISDRVSGETFTNTYDSLDKLKTVSKNGTIVENMTYYSYGTLETKTITNGVNQTYNYIYKDDSTRTLERILISDLTISPKSDILNRQSEKVISVNNSNIIGEYYYYRKFGDHATNQLSTIRYGNKVGGSYVISDDLKYAYDSLGNISKVYENGLLQVSYTYDKLGRISREDNKKINKTYIFSYDNNGNIINKFESNYTTKPQEEIETLTSKNYSYASNSDRLLSYNGEKFEYDLIGNPTTYRGKSAIWAKGR